MSRLKYNIFLWGTNLINAIMDELQLFDSKVALFVVRLLFYGRKKKKNCQRKQPST